MASAVPERSTPQVYKIGMPNAVIGFDKNGMMWMDQGVDCRSMDTSAVQGIDGWGSCPNALGNLILPRAIVHSLYLLLFRLHMARFMVFLSGKRAKA